MLIFSNVAESFSSLGSGSCTASICSKSAVMTTELVMSKKQKQSPSSSALWASAKEDDDGRQGKSGGNTSRRRLLGTILLGTTVMIVSSTTTTKNDVANAFDRNAYPIELYASDASIRDPVLDKQDAIIDRNRPTSDTGIGGALLHSGLWGSALWFLSGSRSNPLATPLANLIYNDRDEAWLKDRNDGLFAVLPPTLLLVLAVAFGLFGYGVDALVTIAADHDPDVSLQLAGVSLIGGGSLELGRIANGEKKPTRQEADRSTQLEREFAEFADKRLMAGGNCHRNEVVRAFRRYYAKYRRAESTQYPLTDLEIEQVLRSYGRQNGLEMSSAGFYTGIQINSDADVFVKR
jgi:hypothetical protein